MVLVINKSFAEKSKQIVTDPTAHAVWSGTILFAHTFSFCVICFFPRQTVKPTIDWLAVCCSYVSKLSNPIALRKTKLRIQLAIECGLAARLTHKHGLQSRPPSPKRAERKVRRRPFREAGSGHKQWNTVSCVDTFSIISKFSAQNSKI